MGLQENLLTDSTNQLALREAIILDPGALIRDAVVLMRSRRLGCVIVAEEDRIPIGVFTEYELMKLLAVDPDRSRIAVLSIEWFSHFDLPLVTLFVTSLREVVVSQVGAPRFELGTSCSQSRRASQAALRPGGVCAGHQIPWRDPISIASAHANVRRDMWQSDWLE